MATAAKMDMTAMTTKSSTSVKPFENDLACMAGFLPKKVDKSSAVICSAVILYEIVKC
jgi:hypothetical protein